MKEKDVDMCVEGRRGRTLGERRIPARIYPTEKGGFPSGVVWGPGRTHFVGVFSASMELEVSCLALHRR